MLYAPDDALFDLAPVQPLLFGHGRFELGLDDKNAEHLHSDGRARLGAQLHAGGGAVPGPNVLRNTGLVIQASSESEICSK